MALFSRADEVVVGEIQRFWQGAEGFRNPVGEFLGRYARVGRRLFNLLAVLISARQKMNIIAVQPHEACQHIARQSRVGMADMR